MRTLLGLTLLLSLACTTGGSMFVPMESTPRAPKSLESVVLLEGEPKDRPFTVIGLVAPPEDEYESYGAMLNAARKSAAAHGADAIFVESVKTEQGWSVAVGFGASGGSTTATALRAKAIVWQ